jgi:hypothetical protein
MRFVEGFEQMDMNEIYMRLQGILPQGAQVLWEEWRQQPSIYFRDVDGDGIDELTVSFLFENEVYNTTFKHDYYHWYAISTFRETPQLRVKGIDLFPASVKGIGGKKWGFINHSGVFVSPLKFDDAQGFQSNGLASVELNGEYGLINRFGQFIVQPMYSFINPFSEGLAIVMDDKGFKVINERGKVVTHKAYSYIGNYQNDRAIFAGTTADGSYLYGFLNKQGKEVIPLQFESVTDFKEGKAVVKRSDGKFELVDRKGKTIQSYSKEFVGELSEGLMVVQPEKDSKYGYMNEEGEILIEPAFTGARAFKNARAIVNTDKEYGFQYGLINRTGKFVIEPVYNDILILGENRVAVGKAIDENSPWVGSKYAIADLSGKILTEFKFTNILSFENGYASATDSKNTFFIDKNGQVAKNLPIAKGEGTLTFEGALIKGIIDMRLRYYNLKGMLVWSQNQIIPLNSRFRIIEKKYKPNKDYLVYYPEIQGMRFESTQRKVNEKLAELAGVKEIDPNKQLESSYTGDFEIPFFKKRLVVIELTGYDYPFGAAHGMPARNYPHIDLESGAFYELKDLFKPESSYVTVLSKIIEEQIKNNPEYSYVWPDSYKGIAPNQPFYVDETHLYIYFTPYEIAPYAAGFPTFKIPFIELDNILNKNGAFWGAFH